jgi:hypothetical protein
MENTYITEIKENYINAITELMERCDDISLLDLLKKLLEKSV